MLLNKILLILIALLLSLTVNAKLEDLFNGLTSIEKPFEMRDPFSPPKFKRRERLRTSKKSSTVWNDSVDPSWIILEDLEIVGILTGKNRRALVKSTKNKKIITVKEGMKLGKAGAEIKAILPGGIILVEKMTNVYGEEEYIETIIPISN